ncbi:uncharacterized protein L3040_000576 [Drepanopeziza brunnea f. sp. 'multigermtubi']|uniref:uncharacterized protein n=1 Tax=Drepanopeziza brunnea f. sp. 'multigermtubi' TaxID=698441 RepID=UPI002392A9DC|nr:hypothetical protein L3040_000576 [Drepanopeziza brunnea f. sp. 'multigermtubi']
MALNSRDTSPSPVSFDAYDMCELETHPGHRLDHRPTTTTTFAHSACLHPISRRDMQARGLDAAASLLIVSLSGRGKDAKQVGDQVLGLLHPRWCQRCVGEREASLVAAARSKLGEIARCSGQPGGEKAKKGAYFLRLNQARVEVVKGPLRKSERAEAKAGVLEIQMDDGMGVGDDAGEMEDMMAGMEEAEIAWG